MAGETFTFGRFRVTTAPPELWADGQPVSIGRRALDVLIALLGRPGELVTKAELAAKVWGGAAVEDAAIAAQIASLRRALGDGADGIHHIRTVSGRGYRIVGVGDAAAISGAGPGSTQESRQTPGLRWAAMILAAIVSLGALVAIMSLAGGRSAGRSWEIDRMGTIAESPLVETQAAPSPSGASVAYAAGPERDTRQIFLKSLSGGAPTAFTQGNGDESAPSWSPAGDRIAFVRGQDGKPCTILVKAVAGGAEREVSRCRTLRNTTMVWSHDGNSLYFHDRPTPDAASRIVRLDIATGSVADVTHPPPGSDGDVTAGLSPNGQRLVFQRATANLTAVFVQDLSTGVDRQITAGDLNIAGADWVDDRSLVVATNPPDLSAVWIYGLEGTSPRRLTLNPAEFQHLVSNTNRLVGFESHNYRHVITRAAHERSGAGQALETRSGLVNGLNVSQAGDLTFARAPGGWGPWDIWVKRPGSDGEPVTKLNASYAEAPRWSPDGRMIAFEANIGGSAAIYVMASDGSALRRLTSHAGAKAGPAWTPDGRHLVFPMIGKGGWRLWEVALDAPGAERPLAQLGWVVVRSDGHDLYGLNVKGGVWRLGPHPRLIAPGVSVQHSMEWDVAANKLVYIARATAGATALVVHPLDAGPDRRFAAPRPLVDDPANTPGVIGGVSFDRVTDRPIYVQAAGGEIQVGVFHLALR